MVDDASTDASVDRIKAFKDPRIRLLTRENALHHGPSAARNAGIRSARSDWVALLDGDDAWHPNFIAEIHEIGPVGDEPIGLLFTAWRNVWEDGMFSDSSYAGHVRRFALEDYVSLWLDVGTSPICSSAVVLHREIALKSGLFNEEHSRGEDKDMWIRMLACADAVGSPRVCSTYFREIPGQMNSTSTNVRHCLCETLRGMIERSTDRRRTLLMRLFNHEVFEYARFVAHRQHVRPDVYRGFYVSLDPARYLILLTLSYMPLSVQRNIQRALLWSNRVTGIPRFRAEGKRRERSLREVRGLS